MPQNRNARIRIAFILTAGILAVEVVAGIWAHSLALLSDAGHIVTDLLALGLTAFALSQADRPPSPRKTFGYQRVGILVALTNGVLLGAIVLGIVVEAIRRLQQPAPVAGGLMSLAALLALGISLLVAFSLRPLAADLSIRSVLVHIWGDAAASAAVLLGGLVILATGFAAVDPVLSLAIAGLIAWSAWKVLRSAVDILLEATPPDLNPDAVVRSVRQVPGVRDLHDLHLWSIGSQTRAMSAHLLVDDQRVSQAQTILAEVREIVAHEFGIEHTTIQFEREVCAPGDLYCVQADGHPHLDEVHQRMLRRASS
jgi:cobalt-zinc-cadmium efflux system protein